ncbi:hypothetical protein Ancab_032550 [Ancistrocladus abbreviatus]
MERQSDPDKISSNTFIPCSLEETKGGGKSASPANITCSGKPVFLNTLDSMDDRHGCRSPMGKSYYTEPAVIKIIKHFLAKPPLARYVSYSAIKDKGALMETQTGTIKRREEKARRNLGESRLGQAAEKEIKPPKEKGPAKHLELAKVKPRNSNVYRTKSSSKKRSLKPKGSGSVKKGGDSNTHGKGGEDVQISGVSIRDSNIEYMN